MVSWSQSIATQHWLKHAHSNLLCFMWEWNLLMFQCASMWMGDYLHGHQRYWSCHCRLEIMFDTYCIDIVPWPHRRQVRKEALIPSGVYHSGLSWWLLHEKHDCVFMFPKTLLCHFDTAYQWPRSLMRAVVCPVVPMLYDTWIEATEIKTYFHSNQWCCNKSLNIMILWPNIGQTATTVTSAVVLDHIWDCSIHVSKSKVLHWLPCRLRCNCSTLLYQMSSILLWWRLYLSIPALDSINSHQDLSMQLLSTF